MAFKLGGSDELVPLAWIGNTAYASIALAMAAAAAGDTIQLSDGEFNEDVTFSQLGLKLVGTGKGRTVITGSVTVPTGKYGWAIEDMTIQKVDAACVSITSANAGNLKNVRIDGEYSTGAASYGIYAVGTLDMVNFDNVEIYGCNVGVYIEGRCEINIYGLKVFSSDAEGIHIKQTSSVAGNESIVYMRNVLIHVASKGIFIEAGADVRISNMIVRECKGDSGIHMFGSSGYTIKLDCTDSIIVDGYNGIKLNENLGSFDLNVRNCGIYDNSNYDIITDFSVDFEYNWWGTDSPAAGQFSGTVDYTPWLTMPTSSLYNSTLLQSTGGTTPAAVWAHVTRRLTDEVLDSGNIATQSDVSAVETKVDTLDSNVDAILVDTNEMQGKLPTNYIMGSSDQTDKDDDIDAILVDTGTTLPATLTTMEGKIDTVDTVVDSVLVDTGTTIPAQLVTMESDIRGSDSDDLKTISDQIDTISSETQVHISVPEPIIIPYGQTTLDGAILAAATTLTVDDDSVFEDDGYITVDSGGDIEYMHYSGKSSNVLTIDAKALFGSSDVGHADAVAVKQMIPHRTKLTIHDAGVPKAPDSAPNIAIDDMEGNAILAATAMTQEGAAVGIYYYDMLITAGTTPDVRELQYTVIVDTNTNEYRKIVGLITKPSTTGEVFNSNLSSLRYCNQDGYLNGSGTFVAWTDDEVGYLRDSSGNRILNGEVRWFLKVDEVTEYAVNPPGFTRTDVNGNWNLMMPTGTFTVQFWSTGTETVSVERTVA